jgi:hypothetical protein
MVRIANLMIDARHLESYKAPGGQSIQQAAIQPSCYIHLYDIVLHRNIHHDYTNDSP